MSMRQVLPRIRQIEYRELVTGPGYNNTTIGAVAEVREDESPERALVALEVWVQGEFAKRGKERQEVAALRKTKYDLEREVRRLTKSAAERRQELDFLSGPRARLRFYLDQFARRFPRLAPAGWRQFDDADDLDDVPF